MRTFTLSFLWDLIRPIWIIAGLWDVGYGDTVVLGDREMEVARVNHPDWKR